MSASAKTTAKQLIERGKKRSLAGNYTEALSLFLQAVETLRQSGEENGLLGEAFLSLGYVHIIQHEWNEAVNRLDAAASLLASAKDHAGEALALLGVMYAHIVNGMPQEALNIADRVIGAARRADRNQEGRYTQIALYLLDVAHGIHPLVSETDAVLRILTGNRAV